MNSNFIKIIKGMFKADEFNTPPEQDIPEVIEDKKCKGVSDPIYLLVDKLLENPKLLKIKEEGFYHVTRYWEFTFDSLHLEGLITERKGCFCPFRVYIGGLNLTQEESDYMIDKLYDIYDTRNERFHELYYKRTLRCMKRSEKALRIELQNKLEKM